MPYVLKLKAIPVNLRNRLNITSDRKWHSIWQLILLGKLIQIYMQAMLLTEKELRCVQKIQKVSPQLLWIL